MTSFHVATQVAAGMCLFTMTILLCSLIKRFHQTQRILKFYLITSIISIISFIISCAIDFGDGVYYFYSGIDVFHTKYYWLIVLTNVFFGISTISLYIFMLGRLNLTFIDSAQYHLSTLTIYLFVILIVLDILSFIFYITSVALLYKYFTIQVVYVYVKIGFAILLVSDFVLNFMILFLFLYKLQQLIISIDCTKEYSHHRLSHDQNENDTNEISYNTDTTRKLSIKLTRNQRKMITVMTRNTILNSISVFFNILFYISLIFGTEYKWNNFTDASIYFLGYSNMIKG
eukprot:231553_1